MPTDISPERGLDYVVSELFQQSLDSHSSKWDKEWLRYLSMDKDYSFYFMDMSSSNYLLDYSPKQISRFGRAQMYHTKVYKAVKCHIWVNGSEVFDKVVFEIGCGPGLLGRVLSRVSASYIGLDSSQLALNIARTTSQPICKYYQWSDTEELIGLKKSVDICVSRHFFIHHNYEDSLWLLLFLRDICKSGGIIAADFFSNPGSLDGHRRRRCTQPLNDEYPSALYDFSEADVLRLAEETALECRSINFQSELENCFVSFVVP